MGEKVETLADLFPTPALAVCVGINPAPTSVAAGHYYQGRLGQRFWTRLRKAGLLPSDHEGFEDDAAVSAGLGFTDVVKRPTASAAELRRGELEHGAALLRAKIDQAGTSVVICTFKAAAEALVGRIAGYGWVEGRTVEGADLFVMPGPYEAAARVDVALASLAAQLKC